MIKSEYDKDALIILQREVLLHRAGKCTCDKVDQTKSQCIAGSWLDNKIPSKQIVQDYHYKQNEIGSQSTCPQCNKKVYKTADIEFLANIGICSSCDHIEGDK